MELRKAYIACERKISEREIEKEKQRLERGEITQEKHDKIVKLIAQQLESKILNLIQ